MTTTICRNYGLLGAEKRCVYTERPQGENHDKIEVEIPDGWELYQTVTGSNALTAPWGWTYTLDEVLAGDEAPCFRVYDDGHKLHQIKLKAKEN